MSFDKFRTNGRQNAKKKPDQEQMMEPYIPEQLPLKNIDYARLFGLV